MKVGSNLFFLFKQADFEVPAVDFPRCKGKHVSSNHHEQSPHTFISLFKLKMHPFVTEENRDDAQAETRVKDLEHQQLRNVSVYFRNGVLMTYH